MFLHCPGSGAFCLLRNLTKTKAYKNDFQLLPKEIDAKVAKIAFSSTRCELSAIESSCRSRLALELDGQQFFAVEGSCRSRPAHEELDGQQFFAIEGSFRRKISKWKSRAQVVRELPQVPQGTTASTTPPFVRAGYDCRNNTTVLRRPEAAGWAPLVCAGPLTTSLRGLWVSGLLPPGNGGTNEGAATQKPTERHKGAATQKPTSVRRNSRSILGPRGGDPRTLASWRHCFSSSCRGNCWWD